MYRKYPRTPHAPWSPGKTSDDVVITSFDNFKDKEIVVTEKIDGENSSLYTDHLHARSISSLHHPSRAWLKQKHAEIKHDIPEGWRICGENVYAFHSIFYTSLPSYFLVFGIYDNNNICLSWDETLDFCQLIGLTPVPVLYRGKFDEALLKNLWKGKGAYPTFKDDVLKEESEAEGYVVRITDTFHYDDFNLNVFKYVRENHVQTDEHWLEKVVVPNQLKEI